jgi:nicotinamide-nucleotide amidase
MKAYIISIGDELLIGQVINKNAAYIASKMNQLSVDVVKICDIPDNIELIKNEIDAGFKAADLVLVTGGLGPTHDDVTREAIVSYFDTELVLNEDALENVKKFLDKRGIEFKEIHETQGYLPKIAEMIPNTKGTAPGMWIKKEDKYLAVMPGVPIEMKSMVDDFICSRLRTMIEYNGPTVLRKTLLTTGLPESELFLKLGDIDALLDGASLAFLPSQFGVRMRISVEGETREEATDKLLLIEQKLRGKVGRYIYGVDNQKLEEVVAKLLIDRDMTISTAESCTGGLIASRLTDIPGASDYFERGIVSYSNGAKVELLNVDEETLQTNGAVSPEVAEQMATGIRQSCGTELGLAVTGIMGPTGATLNKPIGLVYIGLADEEKCLVKEFHFGDDRLINKDKTAQQALEMVRRHLLGIADED